MRPRHSDNRRARRTVCASKQNPELRKIFQGVSWALRSCKVTRDQRFLMAAPFVSVSICLRVACHALQPAQEQSLAARGDSLDDFPDACAQVSLTQAQRKPVCPDTLWREYFDDNVVRQLCEPSFNR
jgi:hypothetical protein